MGVISRVEDTPHHLDLVAEVPAGSARATAAVENLLDVTPQAPDVALQTVETVLNSIWLTPMAVGPRPGSGAERGERDQ